MPNTSPTATDTPNATNTDNDDTIVLMSARRSMPKRTRTPTMMPGHAAGEADQHRLAQELREDVPLRRAHRAPHADLA